MDNQQPNLVTHYLYKLPGQAQVRGSYVVSDLKELLTTLAMEGCSPQTCDFLYIHALTNQKTGEMMELLAVDNRNDPSRKLPVKSNVVPFTPKPRIKLKAEDMGNKQKKKQVVSRSNLYVAMQV